jgi:sRNA-binding regulator protein Hfq
MTTQTDSIRAAQTNYGRDQTRRKKPTGAKKLQGHEAFLKNLETTGAEVKIQTQHGDLYTGVVKRSDAYTISVHLIGDVTPRVFFKHSIEFFQPVNPPVKAAEVAEAA